MRPQIYDYKQLSSTELAFIDDMVLQTTVDIQLKTKTHRSLPNTEEIKETTSKYLKRIHVSIFLLILFIGYRTVQILSGQRESLKRTARNWCTVSRRTSWIHCNFLKMIQQTLEQ